MAAPEFTLFVKPYLEGWANGEEGGTPMTAEILNDTYDAFLLALNDWATSIGLLVDGIPTKTSDLTNDSNFVSDLAYIHTDNNYTTTEKNKLSGVEDNANNYSLPTASASTLGGVKVDGITITIANGVISAVGGGGTDVEGNPSGTPTAVLSSIRIGNDIFSIPGGGGGGSSVSFTQILATGTKIGTITIDGVPTDIYAPTPPTKTSDLTNDSNFVSDASYVHTDNNYTTTEKNKLADLNQVEANPSSGTSAGDLTSIEIDGTKYNIPSGGGGGTTVIANPSGPATAGNLNKLQVGNDIYQIPSGGGSSNGLYAVEETLFNTETALEETSYQLNSSIDNYDFIRIVIGQNPENSNYVFSVDQLHDTTNNCVFYNQGGYGIVYANADGDELTFDDFSDLGRNRTLRGVYGLKLTESASGGGHVILNDAGTSLAQEDNLQFNGVYSHDDSTNGKTVVEITRSMTLAQYQALSADEKKGVIAVTDDSPAPYFTDVVGTLAAGATSITLSDASITANSTIDLYTDTYGVNPASVSVSTGSVTLTFPAQQAAVEVKVRVS